MPRPACTRDSSAARSRAPRASRGDDAAPPRGPDAELLTLQRQVGNQVVAGTLADHGATPVQRWPGRGLDSLLGWGKRKPRLVAVSGNTRNAMWEELARAMSDADPRARLLRWSNAHMPSDLSDAYIELFIAFVEELRAPTPGGLRALTVRMAEAARRDVVTEALVAALLDDEGHGQTAAALAERIEGDYESGLEFMKAIARGLWSRCADVWLHYQAAALAAAEPATDEAEPVESEQPAGSSRSRTGHRPRTHAIRGGRPPSPERDAPEPDAPRWSRGFTGDLDGRRGDRRAAESPKIGGRPAAPPRPVPSYLGDDNRLLLVRGDQRAGRWSPAGREWYINQAFLMEAHRSLEGGDEETRQRLALAMLQSYAKAAAVDPTQEGGPLGMQTSPLQSRGAAAGVYHRSAPNVPLLGELRQLLAREFGVPYASLQVLSDPLFMEVLRRRFPAQVGAGVAPEAEIPTEITSLAHFGEIVDALLALHEAGRGPQDSFVLDASPMFATAGIRASEIHAHLTRPFETVLLGRAAKWLEASRLGSGGRDALATTLLDRIQIVVITRLMGVDTLIMLRLFEPRPGGGEESEEGELEAADTADLRPLVDLAARTRFASEGEGGALVGAMVESGSRIDPIAARAALARIAGPEAVLASSGLASVELATTGERDPKICSDVGAFIGHVTFQRFMALSGEQDAAPYQRIYPRATAHLLIGLASEGSEHDGLDAMFAARGLTRVLQTAYLRMLHAMAEAITFKGDTMRFLTAIEALHDQIQMILAIVQPHAPGTAFAQALTSHLRSSSTGEEPVLPDTLTAAVHHKASAMHSVASILAATEEQKHAAGQARRLNTLVLKDNYYESHGSLTHTRTYDTKVLDGWLVDDAHALGDEAFEGGMPAQGSIDIYLCDFHHNISVTRSEYRVEDVTLHVKKLFERGLVADRFTVAIDCTVDQIRSQEVRKFLQAHEQLIEEGKLNVVLYRSAQKFDMLGLDNYYGGYTITINDRDSYAAFDERMAREGDQVSGLSHQGLAHLAKYGAEHIDAYQRALVENTRMLYDALPQRCKGSGVGPLTVAETSDPGNVFLDISFPDASEEFAVSFYHYLITWARDQGLALTLRGSFGFATTNLTLVAHKVRLNPGLEAREAIAQYARFLDASYEALSTARRTVRGPRGQWPAARDLDAAYKTAMQRLVERLHARSPTRAHAWLRS